MIWGTMNVDAAEHPPLLPPPQPSNARSGGEPRFSAQLSEKLQNVWSEIKQSKSSMSCTISHHIWWGQLVGRCLHSEWCSNSWRRTCRAGILQVGPDCSPQCSKCPTLWNQSNNFTAMWQKLNGQIQSNISIIPDLFCNYINNHTFFSHFHCLKKATIFLDKKKGKSCWEKHSKFAVRKQL